MSKNCRGVQGIGFCLLLFGIIAMATAAIMFFGAPGIDLGIEDGTEIAQMYGIILGVIGLSQFIFGIFGLRAAKHANLLKIFSWMCAADIALNLFSAGETALRHSGNVWPNLIFAAVAFSGLLFTSRAMTEQGSQ